MGEEGGHEVAGGVMAMVMLMMMMIHPYQDRDGDYNNHHHYHHQYCHHHHHHHGAGGGCSGDGGASVYAVGFVTITYHSFMLLLWTLIQERGAAMCLWILANPVPSPNTPEPPKPFN